MPETALSDLTQTFSNVPMDVATLRLFMIAVLAGVIGCEHERQERPSALRTRIHRSIAACLFLLIGLEPGRLPFGDKDQMQFDPLRRIEAVTAGVAFLAAGVIFKSKGEVRNLTTGAPVRPAGAIGLACGTGQIPLASLATLAVVIVLTLLRQIERLFGTHT